MAQTPGELTFEINRVLVGEGVPSATHEVAAAVAFAFRELKLVVEPGGAVALAALLSGKIDVKGKIAVAVLSGGNVDPELFSGWWRDRSRCQATVRSAEQRNAFLVRKRHKGRERVVFR